jgi:hypothetical protein
MKTYSQNKQMKRMRDLLQSISKKSESEQNEFTPILAYVYEKVLPFRKNKLLWIKLDKMIHKQSIIFQTI